MDCKHKWNEIERKTIFEDCKYIAGYSGYNGWGGATDAFYEDGRNEYQIIVEKCSKCGKLKETKNFIKLHRY
jgi:hypothetical protein